MKFKTGDKVQVRNRATGNLVIRDAEVVRYATGADIIFVQGFGPDSLGPWGEAPEIFGVPTRCVESLQEPTKPSPKITRVLKLCFGDKAAEERKKFTLITNNS